MTEALPRADRLLLTVVHTRVARKAPGVEAAAVAAGIAAAPVAAAGWDVPIAGVASAGAKLRP